MSARVISPVDMVIAGNIRHTRCGRGIKQEIAAKLIGVSTHQLPKYETGRNRISSGRLFEISRVLDVPIQSLFEGCDDAA